MLRRFSISTIAALAVFLSVQSAWAQNAKGHDLTIVVNRDEDATELYFAGNAGDLQRIFAVSRDALADSEGLVDFAKFRDGTWDIGDRLLAKTAVTIAERDAGFEAMSLMFHHPSERLPMTTPMEAMLAISVCNGPAYGTRQPLDTLDAYAGYFAHKGSFDVPIRIQFPKTNGTPINVVIHDYHGADGMVSYRQVISGGEALVVSPGRDHPL